MAQVNSKPELSLREQKRQATHKAIIMEATRLVEERGFDQVTVDDICAEVGISRRTFFNYVDCKDSAVLGSKATRMSEEDITAFAATRHPDLTQDLIDTAMALTKTQFRDFFDGSWSPAETRMLVKRRKHIIAAHPVLAKEQLAQMHGIHEDLRRSVEEMHRNFPDSRKLPEVSSTQEARTQVTLAIMVLQLAFSLWHESDSADISDISDKCRVALEDLKEVIGK